jgi:CBS domain-containing protein
MKIKDIIIPAPERISPDASLTEAAKKMGLLDVGSGVLESVPWGAHAAH